MDAAQFGITVQSNTKAYVWAAAGLMLAGVAVALTLWLAQGQTRPPLATTGYFDVGASSAPSNASLGAGASSMT